MGRNDKKGRKPSISKGEWAPIREGRDLAIKITNKVKIALDALQLQQNFSRGSQLNRDRDPRTASRPDKKHDKIFSLLHTFFKIKPPDPHNIANLRHAFGVINHRLNSVQPKLVRLVTNAVANSDDNTGGDTFGYVLPGEKIIYLNEDYFTTTFHKNVTGVQLRKPQTVETRAEVVMHETIHLCYGADGVIHRELRYNSKFNLDAYNCKTGYPQIKSTLQAMNDAYVWAQFAMCLYKHIDTEAKKEKNKTRR